MVKDYILLSWQYLLKKLNIFKTRMSSCVKARGILPVPPIRPLCGEWGYPPDTIVLNRREGGTPDLD